MEYDAHNPSMTKENPRGKAPRTRIVERCPLCGAVHARTLFKGRDGLHGVPSEFTYRRCETCSTVFQDPCVIAEDIMLCYPPEYYTHVDPDEAYCGAGSSFGLRRLTARIRCRAVQVVRDNPRSWMAGFWRRLAAMRRGLRGRPFSIEADVLPSPMDNSRRALDVGCGAGWMLSELKEAGWDAEGLERDAVAADVARKVSGCSVREGDFFTVGLALGSYDLITLSHVIEHLHDPLAALRRIQELLRPRGRAVLWYPNPESLLVRVFGAKWLEWDIPRHLVFPPAAAFSKVAGQFGLATLELRSESQSAAVNSALSRANATGERMDLFRPRINSWDRALAMVEAVLVRVGFRVGEDIVLVLQKASAPPREARGLLRSSF